MAENIVGKPYSKFKYFLYLPHILKLVPNLVNALHRLELFSFTLRIVYITRSLMNEMLYYNVQYMYAFQSRDYLRRR